MVVFSTKSVFDSGCEILVNTINCHGVMGAGIALEFSLRFPKMYGIYCNECIKNEIQVGSLYLYEENGQKILNFPTKGKNPRAPSELSFIEAGLLYFRNHYKEYGAKSIAFPPLGCTNGKLDFDLMVKQVMIDNLNDLDIDVVICMNNELGDGLEKRMTETLKSIDAEMFKSCFENSADFKKFELALPWIDRFSELASSKYLPNENVYRMIWQMVYLKTEGGEYEV